MLRYAVAAWLACGIALVSATGAPRALLIGLDYDGSDVVSLPGIRIDMDLMVEVARTLGIEDIRELWNAEATLDGIRNSIRAVGNGISEDDLVLIYFSGHGTRVNDRGQQDETDDNRDEALVPFDGADLTSALIDDEFGNLLARIPSRRVLVVVDACNSGTTAKNLGYRQKAYMPPAVSRPKVLGRDLQPGLFGANPAGAVGNFIGIMAAQDHELAMATGSGSVLTVALHKEVHAAKSEGAFDIGVEELFARVSDRVAGTIARLRQRMQGVSQHPNLFAPNAAMRGMRLALAERPAATRLGPPEDDPLIRQWAENVGSVGQQLEMRALRQTFEPHPDPRAHYPCNADDKHLLSVEAVAPADGYINLLGVGQGEERPVVLFPNEFQPANSVRKGQVVRIPPTDETNWCLPAELPADTGSQWVMVVATFSERPLDFHSTGVGNGPFKGLVRRNFFPRASNAPRVDATASTMMLIHRKGGQE